MSSLAFSSALPFADLGRPSLVGQSTSPFPASSVARVETGIARADVAAKLPTFKLNGSQADAILSCVTAARHGGVNKFSLIWGPPGTGKTKTISVLLLLLLTSPTKCRVLTLVTVVPGTTERERRIEERGTAFWMQFYTVGTKTFPRSRPRNGVPGTRNARSFPFPGD
jgi:hypothetical protein